MYARHNEYRSTLNTSVDAAFRHLDDQRQLSAHMNERSWKMGWGKLELRTDDGNGQTIGSHSVMDGRAFGIRLYVDEVVIERVPPIRKSWETVGEPRLVVIGPYRMGFELTPNASNVTLRVTIDYDLPRAGLGRVLGLLFGRFYAQWCTRKMALDAQAAFAR